MLEVYVGSTSRKQLLIFLNKLIHTDFGLIFEYSIKFWLKGFQIWIRNFQSTTSIFTVTFHLQSMNI